MLIIEFCYIFYKQYNDDKCTVGLKPENEHFGEQNTVSKNMKIKEMLINVYTITGTWNSIK